MPSNKKVLITGALGFIFSNFIRKAMYKQLHEKYPYTYCTVDKVAFDKTINNTYVNKNLGGSYFADVCDEHIMDKIFLFEKPSIVIHAAAESSVDQSIKDPNSFVKSNVMGTQVIINLCRKYNVEKLIYISTDEVMGALNSEKEAAWTETDPINPRNPYSASKMAGELLVKAAHETHGLNYLITRSSNNYGPRQTTNKLIPRAIECILNDKKIPVYGQGLQIRDWLYVDDNCSAILKLTDDKYVNETYNISANQEFSNIEVVQNICNLMNKGWDLIQFVEDRPGHDFRYSLDSSKLRATGWQPEKKFKDGLAMCINWYLSNPWWFR